MGRVLLPKSFTLFKDQVRYLVDFVGGGRGEQSRWVREAVDMKIRAELKETSIDVEKYFTKVADERRRR